MSPTVPIQGANRASVASSVEPDTSSRPATQNPTEAPAQDNASSAQGPRLHRSRVTSYHHPYQTKCSPSNDQPPSYSVSTRLARFPPAPRHFDGGNEVLPKYTCSVSREGPMLMRVEKISPFQYLPTQDWRSVYVVLCGTQLRIHKVKTIQLAGRSLPTAGKLIRRYSTQHAEIGLASDVEHKVLLPASRLAQFIPTAARRRAFERDPDLFTPIRQSIFRLRLEVDQFLLADSSEERIFNWVNDVSASIDIALPLDDRAAPKPCTIPRRRRRQRTQDAENVNDQRVIEEQERIIREMYPSLARSTTEGSEELRRVGTSDGTNALTLAPTNINEQEAEDIDLAALAEDLGSAQGSPLRPTTSRQMTSSTVTSTTSSIEGYAAAPENFDSTGKWAPPHARSGAQQWRYIRRCMPVLPYNAPRASSILMCHGRRLRINAKMDMLEEWELAPPSYDAHDFPEGLDRTLTLASSLATTSSTISGSSVDSRDGKAPDSGFPRDPKARVTGEDTKRSHHNASNVRGKMPERTLMEEGVVVVAF